MITASQAVVATVVVGLAAVVAAFAAIWLPLAADKLTPVGVPAPHVGATMEYGDELQQWVESLDVGVDLVAPAESAPARGVCPVVSPPASRPVGGRHRAPEPTPRIAIPNLPRVTVPDLAQLDNRRVPPHLQTYQAWQDWQRAERTNAGAGAR